MISSRTLLLFLIALNLLALAWWTGSMEPLVGSVREPGRLKSQIEPNSLRVTRVLADNKQGDQTTDATARADAAHDDATLSSTGASDHPTVLPGMGDVTPVAAGGQGTAARGGPLAALPAIPGSLSGQVAQALGDNAATGNRAAGPAALTDTPAATPDTGPPPMIAARHDEAPQWPVVPSAKDTNPFDLRPQVAATAGTPAVEPMLPVVSPAQQGEQPLTAGGFSTKPIESSDAASAGSPQANWQSKSEVPLTGLPLVAAALSEMPSADNASEPPTCMAFKSLSYIEAREIENELAPFGVVTELSRIDKGDFLVYIEPMSSIQLARRKYDQLKRLGVRDLHVIRAGYYRNGISLGMLRNYELASLHKDQMSDLGVTTMRIGPVNARGSRYRLITRGSAETMDAVVLGHEVLAALDLEPCPN